MLSNPEPFYQSENIIDISHQGEVNDQVISRLLSDIKKGLVVKDVNKRDFKSIYSISVELIENILRHGVVQVHLTPQIKKGKVNFSISENIVKLEVENLISSEDKSKLEQKYALIKGKQIDEIKDLYRHELIHGSISERGGAGLGIFVMAIKSKNNYQYTLDQHENDQLFYKVIVSFSI